MTRSQHALQLSERGWSPAPMAPRVRDTFISLRRHNKFSCSSLVARWVPGTSPGMTLVGVLSASISLATPAIAYDHAGLARQALDQHIRPGYAAFAAASNALSKAATELCAAPSDGALSKSRDAFKTAVLSWAKVEHLRFGPIMDDKRHDRMMFWPDPKGLARRQIEAALNAPDDTLYDQRLGQKSIALQGFSALDVVMFGDGSETLKDAGAANLPRCKYAEALTGMTASIAQITADGWSDDNAGFAKTWLNPGGGNTVYLNETERTQALLQAFLTGIEQARNQRLTGQLGMQKVNAKALAPMLPNSGLAVAFLKSNIEGLQSLLTDGGFLVRQTEPPIIDPVKGEMTVLGTIADELKRAAQSAAEADTLSKLPFKDEAARQKLIAMGFPLKNAYETGGRTIADEANITMGFNSLDGD